MVTGSLRSSSTGLCGDVAIVEVGRRIVTYRWEVALLQWLLGHKIRVTHGILHLRWKVLCEFLLLGVNGRDIGGGIGVRIGLTSLFAMSDEILQVLDGRHSGSLDGRQNRNESATGWKREESEVDGVNSTVSLGDVYMQEIRRKGGSSALVMQDRVGGVGEEMAVGSWMTLRIRQGTVNGLGVTCEIEWRRSARAMA